MNALDTMLTTLVGGAAALGAGLLLSVTPRTRTVTRRALLLAGIVVALLAPAIVLGSNALGLGLRSTAAASAPPNSTIEVGAATQRAELASESVARPPTAASDEMPAVASSAARPATPARTTPWSELAMIGWATGIAFLLGRIVVGAVRLRRVRRTIVPSRDSRVRGAFESQALAVPSAVGIVSPVVVLPSGLAAELGDEDLRAVLRHEQSHVDRRDPLAMLVARIAQAFHWPNLLAHASIARLDALSEALADQAAIAPQPESAPRYASCLVRLAERALGGAVLTGVSPIIRERGRLTRRIDALLSGRRLLRPTSTTAGRAGAIAFGLVAAIGIGCCCPRAERAPRPAPTSETRRVAGTFDLKPGDILRSINGVPVHSRADAINVVKGLPKTTTRVTVVVTRNGQDFTYDVNPFAMAPSPPARARMPEFRLSDDEQAALAAHFGSKAPAGAHGKSPRVVQFSPALSPIDLATGLASPTFTDPHLLVSTHPAYPGKIVVFFEPGTQLTEATAAPNVLAIQFLRFIPGTGNVPVALAPRGREVLADRVVLTPAHLPLANGQYSIAVTWLAGGGAAAASPTFHSFTVGATDSIAPTIGGRPVNAPPTPVGPARGDLIAPTIVMTSPVGGGTMRSEPQRPAREAKVDEVRFRLATSDIVVRFNESIAAASVTPESIRVTALRLDADAGESPRRIAPSAGFPKLLSAAEGSILPSNGFEVVWRGDSGRSIPAGARIEVEVVGADGGTNAAPITDVAGNALETTFRFEFAAPAPAKR